MISPNKERIYITLPKNMIKDLDTIRENHTRSYIIETAIQLLITTMIMYEAQKEAPAEDLEKEKHKC